MKSFIILGCIAALAVAQRPFYAGSSAKGYPELASRFKDTDSDSSSDSNTIANRIGDDNTKTTEKIPLDARGDADLVKTLNTWPRENRPFWLLNADAIEKHRDPEGTRSKEGQKVQSRSSFSDYFDEEYPTVESLRRLKPVYRRPSYLNYLG